MLRLVFILTVFVHVKCDLTPSSNKITMAVGEIVTFQAKTDADGEDANVTFSFKPLNNDVIQIVPSSIQVINGYNSRMGNFTYDLKLRGLEAGQSEISVAKISPAPITITENNFLLVKVYKSLAIEWASSVIGWLYFFAWSISFYPQMYTNYKRKSVVGLNFDFLFFNIVGYLMYSSFNMGMYLAPNIKEQYSLKHPRSPYPVQPNDLFFSTHGIAATSATIFQCFIYERADQNISIMARIIVALYFSVTTVYVVLANVGTVLLLDVLYVCSYIKLCVTITKYMPQVYMNYKRKSTQGWSIGAVLLDFLGGGLSILQMVLDGFNYSDWSIVVGNPTKFGLGVLTIGFDLAFVFQHYWLYPASTSITEKDIKLNVF